jgi:DNA-binding NtrC family response regulator
VIVIDRDDDVRTSIAAALRKDGCEVVTASDGPSAIAAIHDRAIDLVLVDDDAIAATDLARLASERPNVKFALLRKPLTPSALSQQVRDALDRRG